MANSYMARALSVQTDLATVFLDGRAPLLRIDAARLRGFARAGRNPSGLTDVRAVDQLDHPFARVCAVGFACAVVARGDDQFAAYRHLAARQNLQLPECIRFQPERIDIDAKLARGRDLVDVLPAGAGRGEEFLGQRILGPQIGRASCRERVSSKV